MKITMSAILRCFLIFSLINMMGCSDFRTLQKNEGNISNPYGLSAGDTVLLVTLDSQHYEFEVIEITDISIVGEHVEIPFDQISVAKKKEIDEIKTAKAVGGTVLGIGAIWLIVLMLTASIVVFPA